MGVILRNNVSGTLATTVSASDVGLVLTSGHGNRFPGPTAGDYFYATLEGVDGSIEIVRVTERVGDVLFVERGSDDSTPASFSAGTRLEMRVNAACIRDIVTEGIAVTPVYPDFGGNGGLFLRVNLSETGVEWGMVNVPDPLPDLDGNAGRILFVKADETGVEWGDPPVCECPIAVGYGVGENAFLVYNDATDFWDARDPEQVRQILGVDARVFGTGIEAPSSDNEVLLRFASDVSGQISADLIDWEVEPEGVATGGNYVIELKVNNTNRGTITISTSGVVSTTTVGGLPVGIAAGDVIKLVAPSDASARGAALSFAVTGRVLF
jgi:hypothetical protein